MKYHPESVRAYLTPDQFYLYRLIWNRFVASQMMPAMFDDTTVDITAGDYVFRAKGSVPKFAGWLAVYGQGTSEAEESERTEQPSQPAPGAAEGDDDAGERRAAGADAKGRRSRLREITPEQKFTQPPPRFNEGSLVKALEEDGIGRPSTYASIISRAAGARVREQDRGQVPADDSRPPAGRQAAASGVRRHPRRRVHGADGRAARRDREGQGRVRGNAHGLLQEVQEGPEARGEGDAQLQGRAADRRQTCDKCGEGEMVEKAGKFGIFLACSRYPDCDNTKELEPAEARRPRSSTRRARTAASRWSSSAAASGCSSPAPAIRSARRRGRSSRPSRA